MILRNDLHTTHYTSIYEKSNRHRFSRSINIQKHTNRIIECLRIIAHNRLARSLQLFTQPINCHSHAPPSMYDREPQHKHTSIEYQCGKLDCYFQSHCLLSITIPKRCYCMFYVRVFTVYSIYMYMFVVCMCLSHRA